MLVFPVSRYIQQSNEINVQYVKYMKFVSSQLCPIDPFTKL